MSAARRLYLIRHGCPSASFSEAHDAGLDAAGLSQAEAVANRLGVLGPFAIVSSPLRRARETAAPLERRWSRPARISARVSEIPSPDIPLRSRGEWLRGVMASRWSELDTGLRRWRADVVASLHELSESTVVFSHYIAINVAVGEATGDDRVVVFTPDHCSVTVIEAGDNGLRLIERGAEASTEVR
jgi:broad specificity phosphatase PhoE